MIDEEREQGKVKDEEGLGEEEEERVEEKVKHNKNRRSKWRRKWKTTKS